MTANLKNKAAGFPSGEGNSLGWTPQQGPTPEAEQQTRQEAEPAYIGRGGGGLSPTGAHWRTPERRLLIGWAAAGRVDTWVLALGGQLGARLVAGGALPASQRTPGLLPSFPRHHPTWGGQ